MSNFSAEDAAELFSQIKSRAQQLGIFQGGVSTHDPETAPGKRLYCSITLGPIVPVRSSGLAAVSGQVTLMVHVWSSAMQRPLDSIDPQVLGAVCALMGALAGDFTLGGTVREVDLFAMSAQPAYVDFQGQEFRTVVLTVPVIINDMFAEEA